MQPDDYDLICNFYCLERDLFPRLKAGIRPGGMLIAAIHMQDEGPDIKPMNPNFLLSPGELRARFSDWTIRHYYEGRSADSSHRRTIAEVVAVG